MTLPPVRPDYTVPAEEAAVEIPVHGTA